jgi:Flp pilus assembly protein CpaB
MHYPRVDLPARRPDQAIATDEQYRAAIPTPRTLPIPDRRAELMPVVRHVPRVRLAIRL